MSSQKTAEEFEPVGDRDADLWLNSERLKSQAQPQEVFSSLQGMSSHVSYAKTSWPVSQPSMGEPEAKSQFLCDVLKALERAGHKFCVLHGYTHYPEDIFSDVDVLSRSPLKIPKILHEQHVAKVVQVLEHEAGSFYYVLLRHVAGRPVYLALDVCGDFRRNGRVFLQGEEVLGSDRRFRFFAVPSPEVEFAYCLIKRLAKGKLADSDPGRLEQLYREASDQCESRLRAFLPEQDARLITEACQSRNWSIVGKQIHGLRRRMLMRSWRGRLLSAIAYWVQDIRRRTRRILRPTGLILAFIGPDGVGKTTTLDLVEQALRPAFRGTKRYHLRPHFGRIYADAGPVTNPHAMPLRGVILSIAKVGLWWVDYLVSFVFDVFPRLTKSTLILFDRYYDDILIDPSRYRYGGPMWLARWVSGLIFLHNPLVICLDAPVDVILGRKKEMPRTEIHRQRMAYLELVQGARRGYVVDASRPTEEVVADIVRIVLSVMGERTALRLRLNEAE